MNAGPVRSGPPPRLSRTPEHSSAAFLWARSQCLKPVWPAMEKSTFFGRTTTCMSTSDSMERATSPFSRGMKTGMDFSVTMCRRQADCHPRLQRCFQLDPQLPGASLHPNEQFDNAPGLSAGIVRNEGFRLREEFDARRVKDGKRLPNAVSSRTKCARDLISSVEVRVGRIYKGLVIRGCAAFPTGSMRPEPGRANAHAPKPSSMLSPLLRRRMTVDRAFRQAPERACNLAGIERQQQEKQAGSPSSGMTVCNRKLELSDRTIGQYTPKCRLSALSRPKSA